MRAAFLAFVLAASDATGQAPYRTLPPLCLPCGGESHVAIGSAAELDRVHAGVKNRCQEPNAPAEWRNRVEQAKLDFSREALVLMYEVIGTGGKAALEVEGPANGVLRAGIRWSIPKGPALPIATAACYSFAVDKVVVRRVDVRAGGVLNAGAAGAVKVLEMSR